MAAQATTRTDDAAKRIFKPYVFAQAERDVLSLRQRYPKLQISPDFYQAVSHLASNYPLSGPRLPIHCVSRMTIDYEAQTVVSQPPSQELPPLDPANPIRYFARVMLLTGAPTSCKAKDLPLQLKFIVGKRDKSELMCLGGPWLPSDGPDPGNNPSALINTAIRTVKEQTDVDLSACTQWARFLELQYSRNEQDGAVREVSVLFVPDVWNALPSYEQFAATFRARLAAKRKEEEAKGQKDTQKKQEEDKAAKPADPNALEIDMSEPQDEAAKEAAALKAKAEAEAAEKAKEEARKKQEEEDEKSIPKEVSFQIAPRHAQDPRIKNMVLSSAVAIKCLPISLY